MAVDFQVSFSYSASGEQSFRTNYFFLLLFWVVKRGPCLIAFSKKWLMDSKTKTVHRYKGHIPDIQRDRSLERDRSEKTNEVNKTLPKQTALTIGI